MALKTRSRQALGLIVISCCAPSVLAQGAAWEWLSRMNETVRSRNYTGTVVMQTPAGMETLQIYHANNDGQERERVVSLSGAEREVIREGGELRVILPEEGVVIVEDDHGRGLLPQLGDSAIRNLSDHYALSLINKAGRVAGRVTHEMRIRPKDGWRWGYQIWLDQETAMPLELRMLSPEMEVLEQVHFTEIAFHDMLSERALKSALDPGDLQTLRAVDVNQAEHKDTLLQDWEIASPPPGFRLTTRGWCRLPGIASPVAQWVFSDGLASVSIYATTAVAGPMLAVTDLESGGVSTARRLEGRLQITAMGEVPIKTSRHFSMALRPVVVP